MSPKAISCALFTVVAILGTSGAAISGGGAGNSAQPLPASHLGNPMVGLPLVQQTRSFFVVSELAAGPVAIVHAAPATKSVATTGSKGAAAPTSAASKLPRRTTSAQIVHGPTSWTPLNQAIARIPNYRSGIATWVVTDRYGHWGATDLANGDIYISPNIPASKIYSVASHEYAHARTLDNYGWNRGAANVALNRWFGGGDVAARERSADCMAIAQGATWTNYTSCQNDHWREGSRILLAGKRLP